MQPDQPVVKSSYAMGSLFQKPLVSSIAWVAGTRITTTTAPASAACRALKFAHLAKEKTGADVYNFYIDIRTPAKAYDEFYQRIMEEGTHFIRGRVAEVTDAARNPGEEGKLIIQAEDTLIGKQRRIPVDMVILSAGLEPRHDAKDSSSSVWSLLQCRWLVSSNAIRN